MLCKDSSRPTRTEQQENIVGRLFEGSFAPASLSKGAHHAFRTRQAPVTSPDSFTSVASLISSGVSVSGPIRRFQLALALETYNVTHVDPGDGAPNDSHRVEFEGMESLAGETCSSFRVFLGRLTSAKKPAPFWLVVRNNVEEAANMGLA